MQDKNAYYKNIEAYYKQTINSYKDAWKMDEAQAIHYGYWDDKVHSFSESLIRMNEVMATIAEIKPYSKVLDAGCGVGGSSFYLAKTLQCHCTGISLSDEQLLFAAQYKKQFSQESNCTFLKMDYCHTTFANESFDVVWGCESICYAFDKKELLKEVYRLLKPGGVFIMADGMVHDIQNNQHPSIRKWLNGWQVNYLETPDNWLAYAKELGFSNATHIDITKETKQSSRRLFWFGIAGYPYILWNKLFGKNKWTTIQKRNIYACWYQYWGMKKGLWEYGIIKMTK